MAGTEEPVVAGQHQDRHYADTRPPASVGSSTYKQREAGYNNNNISAQQQPPSPPSAIIKLKRAGATSGRSASPSSQTSTRAGKSVSYSKLFSQYLRNKPQRKTTIASSPASSTAAAAAAAATAGHAGRSSASGAASKLIASALNRFKSSAADAGCSNQLIETASSSCEPDEEKEEDDDDDQRSVHTGPPAARRGKRKGFLYLRRSGWCGAEAANRWLLEEDPADSNNNNNNSTNYMLAADKSSRFLYAGKQHEDEHKTCLLEEELEEGEEAEAGTEAQEATMSPKSTRASAGREHLLASLIGSVLCVCAFLVVWEAAVTGVLGQQQQKPPVAFPGNAGPARSQAGTGQRAQPIAGSLVANINCNKIRGHVTLTPAAQGGSQVSARIGTGPPGEVYQWSVHQFPVKPGAGACTCSAMVLGAKLIDLGELHGNLLGEQEFSVQSSLSLMGPESPVGHSLLLRGMKTGMLACATFLPTSRKSNYRAKFHSPISGSMSVFQTAFGTSLVSHLMYSNGSRRHSMHRFDLVHSEEDIITSAPLSGAPGLVSSLAGASRQPANLEQVAWEQREHELELSQCKRFPSGEPLLRNASYQLAVSTENFGMRGRTSLVLPPIPFETFSSVLVVVYSEHDPLEPMACAPLRFVKPKTAAAKFQSGSVQGSIVFSQDSPFDPTLARVNLNLPNSDGHSYGIDELPMIIRRKSDTRVCPNIREIIYNPHQVEPGSVPAEGEATSDQYAVGDLSGKYGSLAGKPAEKLQVHDFNLPLYGPASVIGRAMTVYSADGVAIACSNIELTAPMTTAFATFDFGIQGQFIFRQPVNDCNGDTYVYIEVSKPGALSSSSSSSSQDAAARSLDHNWHIHTNPVDSGLDHLSTTDCQPAGHHFNPYNTSTSHIYARDCTPFNGLRCELGDLAAKMFTLEVPPYRTKPGNLEPDIGKFFGTDIDLPLCGPVSIVNRSVVVHGQDFGADRLACSTVIEFKPRL